MNCFIFYYYTIVLEKGPVFYVFDVLFNAVERFQVKIKA